jgi:hypothetical protein
VNTTRGHERNHESEQIRGDRALLVAHHEGTVAELVDEHRVIDVGNDAKAGDQSGLIATIAMGLLVFAW